MAGKGRKVKFHGSFASKAKAVKKEARTAGAFIRRVKTKHGIRHIVMTRLRGR